VGEEGVSLKIRSDGETIFEVPKAKLKERGGNR
jgi:hypothetical protein